MLTIQENIDLKPYNTFGVPATCYKFAVMKRPENIWEINRFLKNDSMPVLILGNGSNVLFIRDYFIGLVILNRIQGIQTFSETENEIKVQLGAGKSWRDFVSYCVSRGWGGVENLAGIPGTIGASAVQNIGAYDMEAGNTIVKVNTYNVLTGESRDFTKEECQFGYRSSIFKNPEYKHFIVTYVTYLLSKKPTLVTSYKAIQTVLEEKNIKTPTIQEMYDIVTDIRKAKLPDETVLHNAGSFFKNPVVSMEQAQKIQQNYPDMPLFSLPDGRVKLAAGWLIEQCGLKGYREGDAGIHDKQALVLVNYGGATGAQILQIAHLVMKSVLEKFDVILAPEVMIVS